MTIERLSGRVISVRNDRNGSPTIGDVEIGDLVLTVEDASDFHEGGGKLVLHDGSKVEYASADMDADTVTLASVLAIDVPEDTFIRTYPVVNTRYASCEVFGFDDPLDVLIPHHYWGWLKAGARQDEMQELVTIVFDSQDWVVFDVPGVAMPKLSDEHSSRERIFRYTAEGIAAADYRGVKFTDDYAGTLHDVRVRVKGGAVTADATFNLLLTGVNIQTMVIPAGSEYSPMYSISETYNAHDRLRIETVDPSDAAPDLVVWVYVTLDTD